MSAPVKHTPGPWVAREVFHGRGKSYFVGQEATGPEHTLARVVAPVGRPAGTAEANARLMAAAPDLLTALKKMVDWHGKRGFATPEDPDALLPEAEQDPEVAEAMRALAKAEGRQP